MKYHMHQFVIWFTAPFVFYDYVKACKLRQMEMRRRTQK